MITLQIDLINLPVRFGGNEFGDRVRERRLRAHVKDGKRVLTIIHTTSGKNHRDEVNAGIFEQRRGT